MDIGVTWARNGIDNYFLPFLLFIVRIFCYSWLFFYFYTYFYLRVCYSYFRYDDVSINVMNKQTNNLIQ